MFRLAICLFSLLMLTTLPLEKAHQLRVHYRTTQIRRSFQRHAYVAECEPGSSDQVSNEASEPLRFSWVIPELNSALAVQIHCADPGAIPRPNPRLFLHLKLAPPSGSQDPLV
jgi:hypothetical protein